MLVFMKYIALKKPFNFNELHMVFFQSHIKKEIENNILDFNNLPTIIPDIEENPTYTSQKSSGTNVDQKNKEKRSETHATTDEVGQKPPMFQNQCGTICWLNAFVQLLLLTMDEDSLTSPLKELLKGFQGNGRVKSTTILRNILSENMVELRTGQQDSFDFFLATDGLSDIERESILNPISIFTKSTTSCVMNPNHSSTVYHENPEFFVSISIPDDEEAIQNVIENEFHEGTLIGDWRCSVCNSQGGMKKKLIQEGLIPRFILVKLQRAERDLNRRTRKIHKKITPPLGFTIQSEQNNIYAYSLCGVLTHIGEV